MSSLTTLNSFNYYLSWLCFIAILIIELVLFSKIRFKIDRAAIALMITLLLVAACRVIFVYIDDLQGIALIYFIPAVASVIQSFLIYYFVFEMIFISAVLTSESSQELQKKKRNIKMMRAVAAFLQLLVVATISIGVSVIIDYYPQLYQDNLTLIRGMLIARGLAKLSIEIPLLYQFLVCFFIFVN